METTPTAPAATCVATAVREIREFLSTRRLLRSVPSGPGCAVYGGDRRRVPRPAPGGGGPARGHLQRVLRLERGNATGVSESVIEGITHALQARRRRACGSGRPAPHRQPGPPAAHQADPTASPAHGATSAGLHDRHAGVRAQRTTRHPRRQRPRARGSSRPSTPTRSGRPTAPGLFRHPQRPCSSASGTRSPTTWSPCCERRPDAIPTTGSCRT